MAGGTVFESSKLPLPTWFLAMYVITQAKNSVSALELKRHLGVSYPTAWLLKHKIMEHRRLREETRKLTGRVKLDGAYLGGELQGGQRGRCSPNKVAFVAAVQTTQQGDADLMCLSFRRPPVTLSSGSPSIQWPRRPPSSATASGASRSSRERVSCTSRMSPVAGAPAPSTPPSAL